MPGQSPHSTAEHGKVWLSRTARGGVGASAPTLLNKGIIAAAKAVSWLEGAVAAGEPSLLTRTKASRFRSLFGLSKACSSGLSNMGLDCGHDQVYGGSQGLYHTDPVRGYRLELRHSIVRQLHP